MVSKGPTGGETTPARIDARRFLILVIRLLLNALMETRNKLRSFVFRQVNIEPPRFEHRSLPIEAPRHARRAARDRKGKSGRFTVKSPDMSRQDADLVRREI